ncbi:MAG: alginate export family protein [Myxococcales bacterium]|nr:alginate export family protein [Myxococcales bacterium]
MTSYLSHLGRPARRQMSRHFAWLVAGALCSFWGGATAQPKPTPTAAATPMFSWHLEHRSRVEDVSGDFHNNVFGSSTGYSMRTLARVEFRHRAFAATLELADSRLYATEDTPRNTTHVNVFEPLQAFVAWRGKGLFSSNDALIVKAGRMTMDLGSRRVLARSEYRNTINGFTGIDASWRTNRGDAAVRLFAVMPVVRRPRDAFLLADNKFELDREATRALLAGAVYSRPAGDGTPGGEAYLLGYIERDGDGQDMPTANRRLLMPGARILLPPAIGMPDGQIEVIGQFGRSHETADDDDVTSLRHRAMALHATAGYTLTTSWHPRGALQFDYASGDRDRDDNRNNRFDPLFGARRFDFGPTGLWGPIARSNIVAPGARVEVTPSKRVDGLIAYRAVWLASASDVWVGAGLIDVLGDTSRFIGHHLEARVRVTLRPKQLVLELGGARLDKSAKARNMATGQLDRSLFSYIQLTGTL